MIIITVKSLRALRACDDQVALFAQTFPDGMELTRANLLYAAAVGLNVDWWVNQECEQHRKAYEAACEQHLQAYNAAREQHLQAYNAACEQHRQAYNAACEQHWQAYNAACANIIADLLWLP